MSDKAIIVTDMPKSCSKCEFLYEFYGVKKCQLLNIFNNGGKAIIGVDKLNDARKECCPLTSLQEHDKEIRDKVIDEFAEKFIYKTVCSGCSGCANCYEEQRQCECEDWKSYMEIAERMKQTHECD